jgi:hypothetical protein
MSNGISNSPQKKIRGVPIYGRHFSCHLASLVGAPFALPVAAVRTACPRVPAAVRDVPHRHRSRLPRDLRPLSRPGSIGACRPPPQSRPTADTPPLTVVGFLA